MKFLDLFCCCGGISKGVSNVYPDADITGIDITDGHNYPFNFLQSDVFKLPLSFFEKFDLIHASPPCQHYSFSINTQRRQMYPDLVEKTRNLLKKTGKKFTIENIPGSPVRPDLILCGEYFNIRVIRHRVFEINGFTFKQPEHKKHKRPIDTTHSYYMQVAGHGGNSASFKTDDWKKAMGIDWVNDKKHLTQMIPPAYYEYVVKSL